MSYAEFHRYGLPHLYKRIGHRLHFGDRDWTEICGYCSEPLALFEEVLDRGQNLNDKATTWTRKLARRSNLPAYLIAPKVSRPVSVQKEIDRLQARVLDLQVAYPIVKLTAKSLYPEAGKLVEYSPRDWLHHLWVMHREHHLTCDVARRYGEEVEIEEIQAARNLSQLFSPDGQCRLWLPKG